MSYLLAKLSAWFFSDYHFKFQTGWFKRLLYMGLIMKAVFWLINYDLYFGANAVFLSRPMSIGIIKDAAFLLYSSASPTLAYFFILPLLALCILQLKPVKFYFIIDFVIWFLVVNLHNKIYPTLTGGDYLLNQFLFFNALLSASYDTKPGWRSDLKICLHNLAVVAIIAQVCLVYFLSALAKYNDAAWVSGNAISQLAQVHHFNLYSTLPSSAAVNVCYAAADYLVLFYQLTFPILVWFKKIKKPFIILGLLIHLYIALVMGLVGFGLVMMLAYIYFWPFKKPVS